MRRIVFAAFLLLWACASYSQKLKYVYEGMPESEDTLEIKAIHKWSADQASAYNGIYHFGESEAELDMMVIGYDSGMVIQVFRND